MALSAAGHPLYFRQETDFFLGTHSTRKDLTHICHVYYMCDMDPAYAVSKAIKQGRIERKEHCEWCGSIRHVSAHHEDYSKPLEVIWLCIKCHTARHHMFKALTGEMSIHTWQWKLGRREEPVKKIFKDRARLVIYLEARDVARLTALAREEGKLVAEYVRERMLDEVKAMQELEEPVAVAQTAKPVADEAVRTLEPNAEPQAGVEKEYVPINTWKREVAGRSKAVGKKKIRKGGEVDTGVCEHNFFRAACPRCNS